MTNGAEILIERDGPVVTVTLNRPQRRNGVTIPMCQQLHDRLVEIAASDARVLVLRGAAGNFSVGADIDAPPLDRAGRPLLEAFGNAFDGATVLHAMPQVTIAAIDGACAGGGLAWAAACDFRIATRRAVFATAYLRIGIPGDMGLIWLLQRLVGGAKARELLLLPEKFGADEALASGLLTRVVEPDALDEAVAAITAQLAARAPYSLRMMKQNILAAETMPMADYVALETARMAAVAGGSAIKEGFAMFKAKQA